MSRGSAAVLLSVVVLGLVAVVSSRPVETHPRISTTLLWGREIVPILQRRCFMCHSPNNIAMSLGTYADARPWAAAIREEVLLRRMPPWSAVPGFGRFENDPSLTQNEWDLLVAWVDGGAPSGVTLAEQAQPTTALRMSPDWWHGMPDAIVAAKAPVTIAAGAADYVARVDMDTNFKTAQRVHGIAFKPGDLRVVRYAAVYEAGTNRWLFTWTPWFDALHLPEGLAFTLPANAKLSVEIGYRGTDADVSDWSEVGFFTKGAGGTAAEARTATLQTQPLTLAPGASPARARAEYVVPETTAIKALWPEVPPGTTSVEVSAYLPDGNVRPLLWLRDVRADWPSSYVMTDAVPLPKGARVVMTAYMTNPTLMPLTAQARVSLVRVPTAATTF